jgi:hypothetical protein
MAKCSDAVRKELRALYGVERMTQLDIEMGRREPHLFRQLAWTDDEVRAIFAKYHKLIEIPITLTGFDYSKYQEEQFNDRHL